MSVGTSCVAILAIICFGLGSPSARSHQDEYDVYDDGVVDANDLVVVVGHWTSEIRDNSGSSTFIQGDVDGDKDVDGFDFLAVQSARNEGPFCDTNSTSIIKLRYDPATGNIISDATGVECYAETIVLQSSAGKMRPNHIDLKPQTVRTYLQVPIQTAHHIVLFSSYIGESLPKPPPPIVSIGRILPPLLTQKELSQAIDGAWYVTPSIPRRSFELVRGPMPTLGDADRDNDVDSLDLLTIVSFWTGTQEPGAVDRIFDQGDFDFDTDVDSADLLVLLEHWTGANAAATLVRNTAPEVLGGQNTTNISSTSVPEPSYYLLVSLSVLAARRPASLSDRRGITGSG